jgi:hypothetical protein
MAIPCVICKGDVPTGDRVNEGHWAVRFRDHLRPGHTTVVVDGIMEVPNVFEVIPGKDGVAFFYPEPKRLCRATFDHAYAQKVERNVSIVHTAGDPPGDG